MRTKCKKYGMLAACIAAFVCAMLLCAHFFFGSVFAEERKADVVFTGEGVQSAYVLGDAFAFPAARLEIDGILYSATGYLHFPSGKTVKNRNTVLEERGEYELEYRTTANGRYYSGSVTFQTLDKLYSVSGSRSSAYYGSSAAAPEKQGIVVSLAAGDTFNFHKVIDLRETGAMDKVISLFVTPEYVGTPDASRIAVTFTDVYDADNYVTVQMKKATSNSGGTWAETFTFVSAGAAEQPSVGIEASASGSVVYNGQTYTLHSNNTFGTPFYFSMVGTPNTGSIGDEEFSISWDYAQRQLFGNGKPVNSTNMIIDLDEPVFFSDIWEGFTTGEVLMSVSASGYSASRCNFVITQMSGADLSQDGYLDQTPPVLTVDYGDYSETNVPKAIVGKPYRVFPASAFDAADGAVQVESRVYYNYGSDGRIDVPVSGGAFVPDKNRDYTIVYTAEDRSGNKSQTVVTVGTVVSSTPMSVALGEHSAAGTAGQTVTLAEPIVTSALKDYTVSVRVLDEAGAEQTLSGNTFLPMRAGVYTVQYEAESYVESAQASYNVTVSPTDQPIFLNEPSVPLYFIRNCTYSLQAPESVCFPQGEPQSVAAEIFVSEDGGARQKLSGGTFTVAASQTVEVIFSATYGGKTVETSVSRPVKDVGYGEDIRMADYFDMQDFAAESTLDYIAFTTESTENRLTFINAVNSCEFTLAFQLAENASNFGSICIRLTDVSQGGKIVEIVFSENGGNAAVSVNGGTQYPLSYVWGASNSGFELDVDLAAKTLTCGTRTITFSAAADGSAYTGNADSVVYCSVSLGGVAGPSTIRLTNFNGQFLGDSDMDLIGPKVSGNVVRGSFRTGDAITLQRNTATDALDPNITFVMYVQAPDGSFAVAQDGTVLNREISPHREYVLQLQQVGKYLVCYEAADSSGNVTYYSYAVNVVDKTPPTLVLSGGDTEGKTGSAVRIADASVSDDLSAEVTLVVSVTMPNGVSVTLDADSFIPPIAGEYIVRFYVFDEAGNYAAETYKVIVKDA